MIEKITSLIEPVIVALGYELLGLEYLPQGKHSLLRVYIDREGGIGIADCATVSRQISGVLDVEDPLQGQYNLEVSSPGADRPLFKPAHFAQAVGERIKVRLGLSQDGRKKYRGTLTACSETRIELRDEDDETHSILLADIDKANVVFED